MTRGRDTLRADCASCTGLCCVGACLRGALLLCADLRGADLGTALFLTTSQLTAARHDGTTVVPGWFGA